MTQPPLLASGHTDTGPVRRHNEDAFRVVADPLLSAQYGQLYVVADGVGGMEAGEVAAQVAVEECLRTYYRQRQADLPVPQALHTALTAANAVVYQRGLQEQRRLGCTIVAAAVYTGQLMVAHAGDARAYLLRNQQLNLLTRDHTWVQEQVDAQILTAQEAQQHEMRNIVRRVLGSEPTLAIDLSQPISLLPGDRVLLSSDGLHTTLGAREIVSVLQGENPTRAARELTRRAVSKNADDNVTAVVFGVEGRSAAPTARAVIAAPASPPSMQGSPPPPELLPHPQPSRPAASRLQRLRPLAIALIIPLVAIVLLIVYNMMGGSGGSAATSTPIPTTGAVLSTTFPEPAATPEPTATLLSVPATEIVVTTPAYPSAQPNAAQPTAGSNNGGNNIQCAGWHTIQQDEWLSQIASKYSTTIDELQQLNPDQITNPNDIKAGTTICVRKEKQ